MFTLSLGHCLASPRRSPPTGLAVGGAAFVLLALATAVPLRSAVSPARQAVQPRRVVTVQAASLLSLRDAAEGVRARLLTLPGVGAVRLHGLLTTGLEVDYARARLARFGITPGELRAALPSQAQETSPGHLAMPLDSVEDGPQPIADRIVHAGGRSLRVGDVATVARLGIEPVSVLSRDGRPAVDVEIVPALGAAAGSLDRLATMVERIAPQGVAVR